MSAGDESATREGASAPSGASGTRTGSPGQGRWWLRMLIASAALAALLLGAYFLTPAGMLHYHGWRHRTGRDKRAESLKFVADWAVARRLKRETVIGLLGKPDRHDEAALDYISNGPPHSGYLMWALRIRFEEDVAVAVDRSKLSVVLGP